jgi:hypothetical protein
MVWIHGRKNLEHFSKLLAIEATQAEKQPKMMNTIRKRKLLEKRHLKNTGHMKMLSRREEIIIGL